MKKKIFVDMDGVLADFHGYYCEQFAPEVDLADPKYLGSWSLVPRLNMSKKEFWSNTQRLGFWESLPVMVECSGILNLVENAVGLDNVVLLTNASNCPVAIQGKYAWIEKHLPRYLNRVMITKQKHFCAHVDSLLIDDFDKNINEFRDSGGSAILVPRLWNSKHSLADTAFQNFRHEFFNWLS